MNEKNILKTRGLVSRLNVEWERVDRLLEQAARLEEKGQRRPIGNALNRAREGLRSAVVEAENRLDELEHPDCLCPIALCGEPMHYVADWGAPGSGEEWMCENGHVWTKVGSSFVDPREGAHIMTPEETR